MGSSKLRDPVILRPRVQQSVFKNESRELERPVKFISSYSLCCSCLLTSAGAGTPAGHPEGALCGPPNPVRWTMVLGTCC